MGDEVKFTDLINIPPHISEAMQKINWTVDLLSFAYFVDLLSQCRREVVNLAPSLWLLTRREQLNAVWKMAELQLTIGKVDIANSLILCGKPHEPSGSWFWTCPAAMPLEGTKEEWLDKALTPWAHVYSGFRIPRFVEEP